MKLVDLFCGIGGLRLGFADLESSCVFSCEKDRFASQTYEANFHENPIGDITKINADSIPDHDLLLAGFPCQTFSYAGNRAGFMDTRGTLFFHVASVLKKKQPRAFLLENVRGLVTHNKGATLNLILKVLKELGYHFHWSVLDAKDFGIPQKRPRIYIVGFLEESEAQAFTFPEPVELTTRVGDYLGRTPSSLKYYLSQGYLETLKRHKERQSAKGNGFGYQVLDRRGIANTLVVGGMGRERNLIYDPIEITPEITGTSLKKINQEGLRILTPRECARLMGFPEDFVIPVSDSQAYKQFGNSVCVPVVRSIGHQMAKAMAVEDQLSQAAG